MVLVSGTFFLGAALWAQGSSSDSQLVPELIAQSSVEVSDGLARGENTVYGTVYSNGHLTGDDDPASIDMRDETSLESTVVAEVAEFQIAEQSIVPFTDAIAGLDPVPAGAVAVATPAQLNTAVTQANEGNNSGYIYFTASITTAATPGGISPVINNAGLLNSGQGLTIDGRGHRLIHGGSSNSTFNLQGSGVQRTFTLKNIDIDPADGTAAGDNNAVVAFAPGPGADAHSIAQTPNSRYWTVNLHGVRTVNAAGNPAPTTRGFVSLSDGVVNFSGENYLHLGQRRTLINARMVNFTDGNTVLNITRIADITNADARRMNVIRANPSNDTARALGVGLTLNSGAEVSINRDVRSGTGGIEGNAIQITSGGLTAANIRPAILELEGESSLTVVGNPRGTGSSAANNGVVSLRGGSGGVSVTEGSELHVHNTRRGTGSNAGTSALIQEIRGGTFIIEGEDSRATFISESAEHRRQATLRFYMSGGVSNQEVRVTNGAELNVERRRTGGDREVSALRFGQGTGNGFLVENATVNVRNEGTNSVVNPGTSTANGFNAGVEFAANNWFFRVLEDSDMQIEAERGAAINARGRANGEIRVTSGANFTAMGRTAGVGTTAAAIRATGGNVHFHMDNPQFYDFVNTRPGGGRVFALGTRAGNTFTSTNSDISVWRRGVNMWNGEPDRHWTLINVSLRGAQLRIIDAGASYPDFVQYYNTSPHSRRMESFTRISGNNSQPVINEALDLTNADRHVRALAETPQGRIRDPRPVWTNELWGDFTHICVQTGTTQVISSTDTPVGTLVRSFHEETLYEAETNVKTVDGVLRMTHDGGTFLRAGDLYRLDAAWRATAPDLPRNHQASNLPPAFEFEVVRDVVPPVPVTIQDAIVPVSQASFEGTWSLEDSSDDGPRMGSSGIRLYARNGNSPVREITGLGMVSSDNSWTFTANPGQLLAEDIVWVSLADTQDPPNWNPIQPTPVRDRIIPEASWFIVAADDIMPVTVHYFFGGSEHVPYRLVSHQLSFPDPSDTRTANMGAGTSTDVHLYFPPRDRQGYMIESIELRKSDGTVVENVALDANERPLAPFNVSPGRVTIHVNYTIDPDYTRDILVEFRFADFGGTNAGSWTLQASVPYSQVRTGTFNQTGIDRFPAQGLGDFHILDTLTQAQVSAVVAALFEEGIDSGTGDVIPPVIDGLPRGFVPCPENHIQLPVRDPGAATPQMTFPVRIADLYGSRVSAADGAVRRPIVINYVATLEEVTLTQAVDRCPDLAGTTAQLEIFDTMSFNYQVALSRGPIGGRTAAEDGGTTGWADHLLNVIIESDRFADEEPLEYLTRTWHGGGAGNLNGAIRIGTWNGSNIGTADTGTGTGSPGGTTVAQNTLRGHRRVGITDEVTIENVPSTAYIAVTQQINGGPAGTTTVPSAANTTWLNNAIHNRHERDFADSGTSLRYLWSASAWHLSNDSAANNTSSNAIHTTNWANPLAADNNPAYSSGRPMDNDGRELDFRLVAQGGFKLTIVNNVDGSGADMGRARSFSVQLRDAAGNYLAASRQLMLHVGEYEQGPITTDPVSGDEMYEMLPVLTPVTVGANGIIVDDLPALLPGESFSLMRAGGMYQARVVMLDFFGQGNYEVHNHYIRQHEGIQSDIFPGMTAGFTSFNRDYLEITFESYRGGFFIVPSGLTISAVGIAFIGAWALGALATVTIFKLVPSLRSRMKP